MDTNNDIIDDVVIDITNEVIKFTPNPLPKPTSRLRSRSYPSVNGSDHEPAPTMISTDQSTNVDAASTGYVFKSPDNHEPTSTIADEPPGRDPTQTPPTDPGQAPLEGITEATTESASASTGASTKTDSAPPVTITIPTVESDSFSPESINKAPADLDQRSSKVMGKLPCESDPETNESTANISSEELDPAEAESTKDKALVNEKAPIQNRHIDELSVPIEVQQSVDLNGIPVQTTEPITVITESDHRDSNAVVCPKLVVTDIDDVSADDSEITVTGEVMGSQDQTNILDETIGGLSSTGSLEMKSCPVKDDLARGMFPTYIVDITRGKGGKLNFETVTHGIYKNKCGFRTNYPVKWADALEAFVLDGRWDYTLNKSIYTKCSIKIPCSGGVVSVEIAFTTGVICVWGTKYKEWINYLFDSWKKIVSDGIFQSLPPFDIPVSGESNTGDKVVDLEGDFAKDIESLWEEHNTLKTAFSTLEGSVNSLTSNICNLTTSLEEVKSAMAKDSLLLEKRKDQRLVTFIETAATECDGKILKCKSEMKSEMEKLNNRLIKQEARFQSATDKMKNKVNDSPNSPDDDTRTVTRTIKQEQINRIDSNVQKLQTQLADLTDSMVTGVIEALANNILPSTPPTTAPITVNSVPSRNNDIGVSDTELDVELNHALASGHTSAQIDEAIAETKVLVWMDSNGNNIKPDKFWREGTKFKTTYRICDINRELDSIKNAKIGCILIGCGVNDLEELNGNEVANRIIATVERIRYEHSTTKIVLGELTPYHERDKEVVSCNARLRERFRGESMVHLVNWDYLRDEEWSYFKPDRKHVKISATPFFAGGYIAALRRAHNLPPKNQRRNTGHQGVKPTPLMENRIPHPTHQSASGNTNFNYNQSRPTPPSNQHTQISAPPYHNVPPPPPETRTSHATYPLVAMPPPSMHQNIPSSSFSSSMHPNVTSNPRAGMTGDKSLIEDRLKRLAGMRIDEDRKVLVEKLSGLLECVEKW